MNISIPGLILFDHATMASPIVNLSDFLEANEGDPDLCADVLALVAGQGLTVGGGAAPLISITRINRVGHLDMEVQS